MPLIQAGTAPSGLDIFTRFGGVSADPSVIVFDIISPASGTLSPSGVSGFKRTVGHYDARDFGVIPSGHAVSGWVITWTVTSPVSVVTTHSESFEVATGMDATFTNADEVNEQVKLDLAIDDTDFSDNDMEIFLQKSLNRLNRKLTYTNTTSELSISITTGGIIPTPDSSVQDLIVLQMECIMAKNLRRSSVGKGIKVRDGDSEIDTTASFAGHNAVVQDFCAELKDAIVQFLANDENSSAANHGKLITYDNSNIITDVDHNGDSSGERNYISPFDDSGG